MGLFHRATIAPTKAELIAAWAPTQDWGPSADVSLELIGSYRMDDPENQVGMEGPLAVADQTMYHVPLTYRDQPIAGAEDSLICEMQHSALGTRWVYDGLRDDRYLTMLAAVAMTGQGEALGMAEVDGRWYISPTNVRIRGGGWSLDRVPVDAFTEVSNDGNAVVFANDGFELTVYRTPVAGPQPPIGLTATWDGQPNPVVLAEVQQRHT